LCSRIIFHRELNIRATYNYFSSHMNRFRMFLTCFIVAAMFVLLTRLDFLVNGILYKHGLRFSEAWYSEYSLLYILTYQLVIVCLSLWNRSLRLFFALEILVLCSVQDLFFFGLWVGSFPSSQWSWMVYYKLLGFWNTTNQVALSLAALGLAFITLKLNKTSRLA